MFSTALYFGPRPSAKEIPKLNNGTEMLINLNEKPIALTCFHVIKKYRGRIKKEENIICQIVKLEFDTIWL
jgi:hypothetical protein